MSIKVPVPVYDPTILPKIITPSSRELEVTTWRGYVFLSVGHPRADKRHISALLCNGEFDVLDDLITELQYARELVRRYENGETAENP